MAVTPLPERPVDQAATIAALRARMEQVQGGPRVPVETAPGLSGLLQLRTGHSYRIDQSSVALSLLAEPSRAGSWVALVGVPDLGVEAAAEYGLNLDRTILVPEAGEAWAEVAAALIDVVPLVWLRPPAEVRAGVAVKLRARLRKRSCTLVVQGTWPGSEAQLRITDGEWHGAEAGHGRFHSRLVSVECRQHGAPPRTARVWLPGRDGSLAPTTAEAPTDTGTPTDTVPTSGIPAPTGIPAPSPRPLEAVG